MIVAYDYQIFAAQEFGGISRYFCALASELGRSKSITAKILAPLYINHHLGSVGGGIVSGLHIPNVPRTGRVVRALNSRLFPLAATRIQPDIVHETYYAASPTYRGKAFRVLTVFDMIHELWPQNFPASDHTARLKRSAVERADRILCISENTKRDLLRTLPVDEKRVLVTYLGFDRLHPDTLVARDIVGDVPYVLYVGVRNQYKNFLGFARAFAASRGLTENFRIVCFGGGEIGPEERGMLNSLGLNDSKVIHVAGGDEVLAAMYSGAAAFVYPSLYEGFGIPPLEAMSLDCPVVASNTSSIPEVCGTAVEYFDPHELESIKAAIERVTDSQHRRNELVSLGRERCEMFTWNRCAKDTIRAYETLA